MPAGKKEEIELKKETKAVDEKTKTVEAKQEIEETSIQIKEDPLAKKESSKPKDKIDEGLDAIKKDLEAQAKKLETEEKKEKGGFFSKFSKKDQGIFRRVTSAVVTTRISEEKFDELFEEMEITLLENNVAMEVIDKIKGDLKTGLVNTPLQRGKVKGIVG